jgi:hypothetical protein
MTGKVKERVEDEEGKIVFLVKMDEPKNAREAAQGVFFEPDQLEVVDRESYYKLCEEVDEVFRGTRFQPDQFKLVSNTEITCLFEGNYLTLYHLGGIPTYFEFRGNKQPYSSMTALRDDVRLGLV